MNWILQLLKSLLTSTPTKPPVTPPTPPASTSWETEILQAINNQRFLVNLAPLKLDPSLSEISQEWADDMASTGILSHGNFLDRLEAVYPNTAAAEDIAEGQPDASSVVADWMSDPPHRANILGPYDLLGVGRAVSSSGTVYWVADFDQH